MITFCRGDLFESFRVAPRSLRETREERKKERAKEISRLSGCTGDCKWVRCWEWSNLCRINDRSLLFLKCHLNFQSTVRRLCTHKVCKWLALSHHSWRHVYDEERCISLSLSPPLPPPRPYSRIMCHSFSSNFILLSFSFQHSVGHTVTKSM